MQSPDPSSQNRWRECGKCYEREVSVPGVLTSNCSPPLAPDSKMLVTVSSMTVPSPLELSAILSWNSQSYSEMPTVNQLNSLAGQTTKTMKTRPPALAVDFLPIYYPWFCTHKCSISPFLHFLISHFLISHSCF